MHFFLAGWVVSSQDDPACIIGEYVREYPGAFGNVIKDAEGISGAAHHGFVLRAMREGNLINGTEAFF